MKPDDFLIPVILGGFLFCWIELRNIVKELKNCVNKLQTVEGKIEQVQTAVEVLWKKF